jgi:hypothetical protein
MVFSRRHLSAKCTLCISLYSVLRGITHAMEWRTLRPLFSSKKFFIFYFFANSLVKIFFSRNFFLAVRVFLCYIIINAGQCPGKVDALHRDVIVSRFCQHREYSGTQRCILSGSRVKLRVLAGWCPITSGYSEGNFYIKTGNCAIIWKRPHA